MLPQTIKREIRSPRIAVHSGMRGSRRYPRSFDAGFATNICVRFRDYGMHTMQALMGACTDTDGS